MDIFIEISAPISLAVSMTTTREMSRSGSAGGKKKIILARAPRRRKREDIPLVRLSSSGWFLVYCCTHFLNDIFTCARARERE